MHSWKAGGRLKFFARREGSGRLTSSSRSVHTYVYIIFSHTHDIHIYIYIYIYIFGLCTYIYIYIYDLYLFLYMISFVMSTDTHGLCAFQEQFVLQPAFPTPPEPLAANPRS